jgi:hypothetical protein
MSEKSWVAQERFAARTAITPLLFVSFPHNLIFIALVGLLHHINFPSYRLILLKTLKLSSSRN